MTLALNIIRVKYGCTWSILLDKNQTNTLSRCTPSTSQHLRMTKSSYVEQWGDTMRRSRPGQQYGTLVSWEAQRGENPHRAAELLTGPSLWGLPSADSPKESGQSSRSEPAKEFWTCAGNYGHQVCHLQGKQKITTQQNTSNERQIWFSTDV